MNLCERQFGFGIPDEVDNVGTWKKEWRYANKGMDVQSNTPA